MRIGTLAAGVAAAAAAVVLLGSGVLGSHNAGSGTDTDQRASGRVGLSDPNNDQNGDRDRVRIPAKDVSGIVVRRSSTGRWVVDATMKDGENPYTLDDLPTNGQANACAVKEIARWQNGGKLSTYSDHPANTCGA